MGNFGFQDGDSTKLKGADDTVIGNNGDSLKTEVTASALPSGAATSANQSTTNTRIGDVTETAPGSDTASSGLNGRLQRIAQRLSSILTGQTDGTQQTKLKGNTDGTLVGNVGDALKVTAGSSGQKELVAAGQVFSVVVSDFNLASSTTDNPIMLIKNPSGSGKNLYIIDIFTGTTESTVATKYQVFANPTVTTNGTSLTVRSRTIKTSPTATVMEAYSGPTVSASGNSLSIFVNQQAQNAVSIITSFQVRVEANNTLLITGRPSSNNRTANITVVWSEE